MGIELDTVWNRPIQLLNDEFLHNHAVWKMIHISAMEEEVIQKQREWVEKSRSSSLLWSVTCQPPWPA